MGCVNRPHTYCYSLPSLTSTVESMRNKLQATPLVLQLPLGEGRGFSGVVDLLSMDVLLWEAGRDGSQFTRIPLVEGEDDFSSLSTLVQKSEGLPLNQATLEEALRMRYQLAEQVRGIASWCLHCIHTLSLSGRF